MTTPRRRRLEVEDIGDVAVVNFIDKKILDEQNIQMIGDDLFRLVDELGRKKVVLNFGNVEFLSSAALGKIITLHRKLQAVKGKLIFCNLLPDIQDCFKITKLDKLFSMAGTEEDAIGQFGFAEPAPQRCPVHACGSTIRPVSDTQQLLWFCAECRSKIGFEAVPFASAPVAAVELETYKGESIRIEWERTFWAIRVTGQFDLFAGEQFEKLWSSIPDPKRALIDLSAATELSPGGADTFAKLLPVADSAVFLLPPESALDGAALPALPRFATRAEAVNHLAVGSKPTASPLMTPPV